jgi:3',5'-cyclic AMP phosphodiesterase CpdA
MKIAFCSDLHLEFSPIDFSLFDVDADVLVLAGDILLIERMLGGYSSLIKNGISHPSFDFFDYVCSKFKKVLWVFGNHEFYGGNLDWLTQIKRNDNSMYQLIHYWENLHVLDCESIIIDGIKFYGGTCWTDMNNDPIMHSSCHRMLNDFRAIFVGNSKLNYVHWLEQHQRFLDNFEKSDVVISHHSPSYKTTTDEYLGDKVNPLYSSNLEHLMGGVKYWISGHQHGAKTPIINGCQLLNNARGYPREDIYEKFKVKVIDL